MPLPEDIFPEDKLDPTVNPNAKMSVEQTLGVMGHVKTATRKRHWRYLVQEETNRELAENKIREFYKLPPTAVVVHRGTEWAAWGGEGEPGPIDHLNAFEPTEPVEPLTDIAEIVRRAGQQPINSGPVYGTFPDEESQESREGKGHPIDAVLAEVVKNAPPGTFTDAKTVAMIEAGEREAAIKEANKNRANKEADAALRETWAYSSKQAHLDDSDDMRRHFKAPNGVVEAHPSGGLMAIWLGKGAPTRPAFPETARPNRHDADPGERAMHPHPSSDRELYAKEEKKNGVEISHVERVPDLPKPVKVSPFAPANALNDMGLKIYGMSKEAVFSESFRQFLVKVSDSMHAEAARLELTKVRAAFDNRKP